jgi:hypothetical protein
MAFISEVLKRKPTTDKKPVPLSKVDYGGIYEITYKDGEKPLYYVMVLHPKLDGKLHCLDLSLIDKTVFENFFEQNKVEEQVEIEKRLEDKKGLIKDNIRIAPSFYSTKIKNNNLLIKNKPYKTLDLDKITKVKYIIYENN